MENKELTYGEKAVGLTFNPGNDTKVDEVKKLYSQIIDLCHAGRSEASGDPEKSRLFSKAITDAQGGQMWAVKAITWKS